MPGLLEEQHDDDTTRKSPFPHAAASGAGAVAGQPKGVVLGKDGKPYGPLLMRNLVLSAKKELGVGHARPP